jgi:peroxiredoxin
MAGIQGNWKLFSAATLVFFAGWIAATALFSPQTTQGSTPAPVTGFLAPDFTAQSPEGTPVRLDDLRGRPVILNVWASWCPPCKAEMPALEAVHQAYAEEGLVVLGLNTTFQDSEEAALQFAAERNLSFPLALDLDGTISNRYQIRAMPTTFFIGADGVIRDVIVGGPMSEALLRSEVLELLEER